MRKFKSDFIAEAVRRGFLHQCTDLDGLDALLAEGLPVAGYVGYDCTAPSLHVGSLVSIMLLRLLQRTGHRPIVLMGGGTTQVGDPSGKDEQRQLLTKDDIARNMTGIKSVFERFLVFGKGKTDTLMVDNADWLDKLRYIDVLREVGRHFSVNRMLTFDSVKLRLEREQPLSFLEFNYMVLQAYDFLELARRYDCRLQMGGSDQWGNIVSGVELARRIDQRTLFGLTTPLITLASGAKMGKTASGAVWLNADLLAPYGYWQFWRNVDDADVGRFLRLFTELPETEVKRLEALGGAERNEAKKALATEATALAHGREEADAAAATARQTFEEGETGEGLPTVTIKAADLDQTPAFKLLVIAGAASSNAAARRLIRDGGVRVQDQVITDEMTVFTAAAATPPGIFHIRTGKKNHYIVKVTK